MKHVRILVLVSILVLTSLLLAACGSIQIGGSVDENVATINAIATRGAGGDVSGALEGQQQQLTPTVEPTATPDPNFRDLTLNPNALLVQAWGQVAGQGAGSTFTIIATDTQVGTYIISDLQLRFADSVQGGSVTLAPGQLRLDIALNASEGQFGSGTVSFQPTLNTDGTLRLNPQGANFNGITVPNGFTTAIGDSVNKALTGDNANVSLTELSLDNNRLVVAGSIR